LGKFFSISANSISVWATQEIPPLPAGRENVVTYSPRKPERPASRKVLAKNTILDREPASNLQLVNAQKCRSIKPAVVRRATAMGMSLLVVISFTTILIVGFSLRTPQASAYTPHIPIVIGFDTDFQTGDYVTGGTGTESDPYIIAGWEILSTTQEGIYVHDTTAYFVIRNVYVHGSGGFNGIYFSYLVNGAIVESTLTANSAAVRVSGSSNILIANNTLDNQYNAGIWLSYATNVRILNNSIDKTSNGVYTEFGVSDIMIIDNSIDESSLGGVVAWGPATRFTIMNNSMSNTTSGDGLTLSTTATDNLIAFNRVNNNSNYGMALNEQCYSDTLKNNTIRNNLNGYGIRLYAGDDNVIENNTVKENALGGISIGMQASLGNNVIANNTVSDNFGWGITSDYSDACKIFGNIIERNSAGGIDYISSNGGTVDGNSISDNDNYGLMLESGSNFNTIANNVFIHNGLFADFLFSDHNSITSNTVNGKPLVFLENVVGYTVPTAGEVIAKNCTSIIVRNLNLSESTVSVELWGSTDCTIEAVISTSNTYGVYMENYSSRNNILLCNLSGNSYGVYATAMTSFNTIQLSTLNSNSEAGVALANSNKDKILSNDLIGNGIGVQTTASQWLEIAGNFVKDSVSDGLSFVMCQYAKVKQNDILNAGSYGIDAYYSSQCVFENNMINSMGIGVYLSYNSDNNLVQNNTIYGNQHGVYIDGGLALSTNCDSNKVSNNTITGNTGNGLFLRYAVHTVVSWNNFTSNGYGILVNNTGAYSNWIYLNNFTGNTHNAYSENSNNSNWWNTSTKIAYHYGSGDWYGYLGNRYGDYGGVDSNGDGVGETPYTAGLEQDHFPLVFTPAELQPAIIPEFPSIVIPLIGLMLMIVGAGSATTRRSRR